MLEYDGRAVMPLRFCLRKELGRWKNEWRLPESVGAPSRPKQPAPTLDVESVHILIKEVAPPEH
jgi:hypothetical protein